MSETDRARSQQDQGSQQGLPPLDPPTSQFTTVCHTDFYQITMAYAYWKNGRQDVPAAFEVFFRRNPFNGEYTVFAGLEEVLRFVQNFHFPEDFIQFLHTSYPYMEEEFLDYLRHMDCSKVTIRAVDEGTIVFPRTPLIAVSGPIGVCQLLETPILNLVNYPSLIATNAARMRVAVGPEATMLEFGLRRAQGPNGGLSASRYAVMGGFDATSNALAGQMFGIPVSGTHAHSFVQSYSGLKDLTKTTIRLPKPTGECGDTETEFVEHVVAWRERLGWKSTNESELAAFIAYAQAFPTAFTALVDSYNVLKSGVPNYICIALALVDLGYPAGGIRLDSGDLSYLSLEARKLIDQTAVRVERPALKGAKIVVSNDISEQVLIALQSQGHAIDVFGIGTNLVTCAGDPALGCVYKLVECNGLPRIKVSQDKPKMTIPGQKRLFRLFTREDRCVCDLLTTLSEGAPKVGEQILVRHPFEETKRARVIPVRVDELLTDKWIEGRLVYRVPTLLASRAIVEEHIRSMRPDILRQLNPTPYKVSLSSKLFDQLWNLFYRELPIGELN